jgi:hypothetical protein
MAFEKRKEPIKISIRQYVDNPYRGSSFLASRKVIKEGLNGTFVKLLQNYRSQFFAVPYRYPNGDVLFHVRVPSEDYRDNKIVYDVLFRIEFDPNVRYSLRKMKLFSNSPGFLFTYAYVYYHHDMIIPEFVGKLPPVAITQQPAIRNPFETLGFEKSTYIAARYLLDGFILRDSYIERFGKIMNPIEEKRLQAVVADPAKLVEIYALAKELQAKTRRTPVNQSRRKVREELRKQYLKVSKESRPKKTGVIFKRGPQSKITAKKAKRNLTQD